MHLYARASNLLKFSQHLNPHKCIIPIILTMVLHFMTGQATIAKNVPESVQRSGCVNDSMELEIMLPPSQIRVTFDQLVVSKVLRKRK